MVLSVALNQRFNFLNSNAFRTKPDHRTRERRAIVDITIPDAETYVTGGVDLDLSKIRNFVEVYSGIVVKQPLLATANLEFRIEPASNTRASGAKLSVIVTSTGAELGNGLDIVVGDSIVTAEIIGI